MISVHNILFILFYILLKTLSINSLMDTQPDQFNKIHLSNLEEYPVNQTLLENIKRRQNERQEQFSNLRRKYNLSDSAKQIVELPFKELQEKLQNRELFAKDVLTAFIAKALEVTDEFNCVTEFIPQAQEWAATLDSIHNGNKVGPLHGLPVAIKDDYNIKGMDSTLGFAKNLYKPANDSAVMVKALLNLGAVPFAKTNVYQSLYGIGSDNPIYGETLNALNKKLAPGGSSAGSGCIVAAGGAPFALGSDTGASLRIPAHFHGISTLRPTSNRLSYQGIEPSTPELISFTVPGILAPTANTLSFVFKAITENCILNELDPSVVPIPWNEAVFSSKKKLRIGYFTSLRFLPAFEDTQKAVLDAKNALESEGHTLVEFKLSKCHYTMLQISNEILLAEKGMQHLVNKFEGEPLSYSVAAFVAKIRKLLKLKEKGNASQNVENQDVSGTRREKIIYGDWTMNITTAGNYVDLLNERKMIILETLKQMEDAGIDLLLSPTYPYAAVNVENGHETFPGIVYTFIWNLMDFPTGVVRFGTDSGNSAKLYDDQNDSVLKKAKEIVTFADSNGMPITVQIIGKPFKEEMVLRILVELENLYRTKQDVNQSNN